MMSFQKIHPAPISRRHGLLRLMTALLPVLSLPWTHPLLAQDWVHLTAGSNNSEVRLAAANFEPIAGDPTTLVDKQTFDTVLFSDLSSAGIFAMVSKSLAPQATPGSPSEINLGLWAQAPTSAAMVAFGNISIQNGNLVANGFLDDTRNSQYPQVFAKQYVAPASDQSARELAHQFADDIIFRLGGGVPGIAESKIFYAQRTSSGDKEIWMMDYDGANKVQLTHLGEDSISPAVSPDNSLVAFSTLTRNGFELRMYSLLLGRLVHFTDVGSANVSPAWAPTGQQLAFSSSRSGSSEIWISDPQGSLWRQITNYGGLDVAPSWNPKTGTQIAFISGRTGLPQLYIMDADGSGVTRMTDGGYATSPSWSPNGQFIAFAWDRHYGPGAPGGQDIYVMEVATKRWIQLTHDIGRCDFPTWSPDGRHIAFANSPDGHDNHTRIVSMLADGTQQQKLTSFGADMPNWSWK
jgi:TolB protein